MRLWGRVILENRAIKDITAEANLGKGYQADLQECIMEICDKFDIEKPYWLKNNVKEYNQRRKTSFTKENFIEEIQFDKFVIEEIED